VLEKSDRFVKLQYFTPVVRCCNVFLCDGVELLKVNCLGMYMWSCQHIVYCLPQVLSYLYRRNARTGGVEN
jgi:hypothetical protein